MPHFGSEFGRGLLALSTTIQRRHVGILCRAFSRFPSPPPSGFSHALSIDNVKALETDNRVGSRPYYPVIGAIAAPISLPHAGAWTRAPFTLKDR